MFPTEIILEVAPFDYVKEHFNVLNPEGKPALPIDEKVGVYPVTFHALTQDSGLQGRNRR